MKALDSRLKRLEAAQSPSGVVVLPWDGVESREQCIRGHGGDPASRGVAYVLMDAADLAA